LREATRANGSYFYEIISSTHLIKGTALAGYIENGTFSEDNIGYMQMSSNFLIPKVGYILSYISFNSYLCISLFFTFFVMAGTIGLYKAFKCYYPGLKREISWATLFLPSVLFWVSALSKESLCFGALGILFYFLVRVIKQRKPSILGLASIIFCSLIILNIKNYILLAFLPGLVILFFFGYVNRVENKLAKVLASSAVSAIVIILIIFLSNNLDLLVGEDSERYKKDALLEFTSQQVGRYERQGGSAVNISEMEFDGSLTGFIRLFPKGIFTAYYRPLPWEINNLAMLFSGIECLAFLIITLYVLYLTRIVGIIKVLVKEIFALQCFVYSMFFGGFVGMTTFNLGTIARYKTPALPFFIMLLFIIINKYKKPKTVIETPE
jgi:hypothetical protein